MGWLFLYSSRRFVIFTRGKCNCGVDGMVLIISRMFLLFFFLSRRVYDTYVAVMPGYRATSRHSMRTRSTHATYLLLQYVDETALTNCFKQVSTGIEPSS